MLLTTVHLSDGYVDGGERIGFVQHSMSIGAGVAAVVLLAAGCSSPANTEAQQTVFAWFGAASQGDCARLRTLSLAPADLDLCAAVRADDYSPMPSVYRVDVEVEEAGL